MNKKLTLFFSLILLVLFMCLFVACDGNVSNTPDEKIDPTIIDIPKVDKILKGNPIKSGNLVGKFDVDGILSFENPDTIINTPSISKHKWIFQPTDNEKYYQLFGNIDIETFEYKLTFKECGGFELEDIFFNESYILKDKPITAKNEYRFDGWSETEEMQAYIDYPYSIHKSQTLYAGYRFHTSEKLSYGIEHNNNEPTGKAFVSALWGKNGIVDYPSGIRPFDPPVESSISGEVIVADMYIGLPVESVSNFSHTNVTNIIFPNFVENIGSFMQCQSLGPDLIIPNSVNSLSYQAFDNCHSLKRIEFEEGEGFIKYSSKLFYASGLTEIILNRISVIYEWTFAFTNLKSIIIPESVTHIHQSAFAGSDLVQIEIEGNNLEYVGGYAFNACPLTSIAFQPKTRISPDAFRGSLFLEEIDITDEQINWIAQDLHEAFIGVNDGFTVVVERDSKYGGLNYEGEYLANTEIINLKFEKFSLKVLDALIHEFFHHYQYVLAYGAEQEDFYSVPVYVSKYSYTGMMFPPPYVIIANDRVLYDDGHPEKGYLYESIINSCVNQRYILIDEEMLNIWRQEYIPLLSDGSNWDEYWNQPFESDARGFASLFTGIDWE